MDAARFAKAGTGQGFFTAWTTVAAARPQAPGISGGDAADDHHDLAPVPGACVPAGG